MIRFLLRRKADSWLAADVFANNHWSKRMSAQILEQRKAAACSFAGRQAGIVQLTIPAWAMPRTGGSSRFGLFCRNRSRPRVQILVLLDPKHDDELAARCTREPALPTRLHCLIASGAPHDVQHATTRPPRSHRPAVPAEQAGRSTVGLQRKPAWRGEHFFGASWRSCHLGNSDGRGRVAWWIHRRVDVPQRREPWTAGDLLSSAVLLFLQPQGGRRIRSAGI